MWRKLLHPFEARSTSILVYYCFPLLLKGSETTYTKLPDTRKDSCCGFKRSMKYNFLRDSLYHSALLLITETYAGCFCWFIIPTGRSTDLKINREDAGSHQKPQLDSNVRIKLLIKCARFFAAQLSPETHPAFCCRFTLSFLSTLWLPFRVVIGEWPVLSIWLSLLCSVSFSVWMEI